MQAESTLLSHASLDRIDRLDNSGQASFDSADTENNVVQDSNTPRTRTSPRRRSQTRKSSKPTLIFCNLSVFALNSNVSPATDIQYYHDKNHAFLKNEKQNLSQFKSVDYGSTQERHSHDTSLMRPNASERKQKRKLVEKLRSKMELKALKHIVKKQAQYSSSESSIESFFSSSSSSSSSSSLDEHTRYQLARNQLIEQWKAEARAEAEAQKQLQDTMHGIIAWADALLQNSVLLEL